MRAILTFALLFSSASAWSDWIRSGESSTAVYYIDPDTIVHIGQLHRFWALQNMKEAMPGGASSIRALQEYDCAEVKIRYISISAYSEPMAGGQVLVTDSLNDDWTDLPRGAKSSIIHKVVCSH